MNTNLKLEQLCHGELTFYDINKNCKCGNNLKYKYVECKYLDKKNCLNEFEEKVIFQYVKK